MIGGHVHRGYAGTAGEIGHTQVDPAAPSAAAATAAASRRSSAPTPFSTCCARATAT
ncbi:ROK family protein [Oerskovia sp. M15]